MLQQPAITLTNEERATLEAFVHSGNANALTLTCARILLKSAEGWSTAALAEALDVCQATITNVRQPFAQGGLEAVLHDKVQQHRRSALFGLQAAYLIAIACSPAPDGHDHWTVRLLVDKAVELGFVNTISIDTIERLHKKRHQAVAQEHWCQPKVGGVFVAAMEDVLDVYEQAYDPAHPLVCFDEKSVVLHADLRPTLPAAPGVPERIDCEYERKGTANLFFLLKPQRGWRQVTMTAQCTKQDYAKQMRWLVDVA